MINFLSDEFVMGSGGVVKNGSIGGKVLVKEIWFLMFFKVFGFVFVFGIGVLVGVVVSFYLFGVFSIGMFLFCVDGVGVLF